MSDYLGNLIGKSFGQAAAVQPQRAPLFAPSPYLTGALARAAVNAPAADGRLLPSERTEDAARPQPDFAASDAQEPLDRGQRFPVSTDLAAVSRRSALTGREQTLPPPGHVSQQDHDSLQPQRWNITQGSAGDRFDPSETPRRSEPSAIQGEPAQRGVANKLIAQDRSMRSPDITRASSPDIPPVDFDDRQRRSAASAPQQETPRLQPMAAQSPHAIHEVQTTPARATVSEASVPQLETVNRRPLPVEDPPGQGAPESYRSQRLSSIAGAAANGSRLATIRTAVPVASVSAQDAAAGGRAEPEQMETNLTPGETRPVPASAAHPMSSARLTGALAAQPAPVQQTIHVTIGRIEVRATPPPAPTVRKQAAAPVMSLDEYLKMRSGGRR